MHVRLHTYLVNVDLEEDVVNGHMKLQILLTHLFLQYTIHSFFIHTQHNSHLLVCTNNEKT